MLNILLVGSKFLPEYAGAGLRIHNTYRRLQKQGAGLAWRVITGSTEYPGDETYVHDGIAVQRISSRLFPDWRNAGAVAARLQNAIRSWCEAARLCTRLRRSAYDVLHVFGSTAVTAAAIAWAAVLRKPLVVELVTTESAPWQTLPGLRIDGFLRRRLSRRTLIVAISAALAERCRSAGFDKNVWSRPNPIDGKRFFPAFERRAELRAQHTPFGQDDLVLCMIAKFMPQKNQIFLLDVLAKLPERFKLVLAGPMVTLGPLQDRDQAYVAELRRRISALGLEQRILVVPEFVEAHEFIQLSDVFMLPNRDEGLATPMLESLACGVPVVANANEAAFRQWVEHGSNGFLCPLDTEAWAAAVAEAVALPQDRLLAASRVVTDAASAERIDREFLRLVEAVAALPPDAELDVAAVLRASP
jgi:glycosyltransferase involved in cell wall biosynthesis